MFHNQHDKLQIKAEHEYLQWIFPAYFSIKNIGVVQDGCHN